MAKDQACKIQILTAKHPDILQTVDGMFNKFYTALQVHQLILHKYHEEVGLTAIRNYKHKHWQVFKDMVREQKAAMVAIAEIIGEDGLDMAVNALLWQELQGMTPAELMSLKKVLNDAGKVAVLKKQFALLAEEHRQKMKERKKASEDSSEDEDPAESYARAQRVVAQVKEMFGIGRSVSRPTPQLPPGAGENPPAPQAPATPPEPVNV